MKTLNTNGVTQQFFSRLSETSEPVLLLDYDGTLAPFTPQRDEARAYPGVKQLLQRICRETKTRLVMITGRPAWELRSILRLDPIPEIWGNHGFERLSPSGEYQTAPADDRQLRALLSARNALVSLNLHPRVEQKPAGLAVHWRGLATAAADHARNLSLYVCQPIAEESGLRLTEFDGGIELCLSNCGKGYAVQRVLSEVGEGSAVAYLGDDDTDEDAFRALRPQDMAVLVRPQYRDTCAQVWLKPPEELLRFLGGWLTACGGVLWDV